MVKIVGCEKSETSKEEALEGDSAYESICIDVHPPRSTVGCSSKPQ